MKFSLCAASIMLGSILGEGIASPVQARRNRNLVFGQRDAEARKKLTKEEKEMLKYFHEPGYVPPHRGLRHGPLPFEQSLDDLLQDNARNCRATYCNEQD
jgi:hypothetical protein